MPQCVDDAFLHDRFRLSKQNSIKPRYNSLRNYELFVQNFNFFVCFLKTGNVLPGDIFLLYQEIISCRQRYPEQMSVPAWEDGHSLFLSYVETVLGKPVSGLHKELS